MDFLPFSPKADYTLHTHYEPNGQSP
ncbi:hypothetical protein [Fangia hongkongensis]